MSLLTTPLLALAAAAQAANGAAAEAPLIPAFFTGERLYEICRQPNAGQCSMYVVGVLDSLFLTDSLHRRATTCPTSLTNRQAAEIVTAYLERNRTVRARAASVAVTQAMAERFPCARPAGGRAP